MKISRRYTEAGKDPFTALTFATRTSKITEPDGTVIFEAPNVTAPEGWSQVAVDVLAQKYFRKAGVPVALKPVDEEGVPEWLRRSEAQAGADGDVETSGESDSRQVFRRLAGCWTYWGYRHGYFDTDEDARAFYD